MGSEDTKDMLKNVDWKTVGGSVTTDPSQPVVKKRLPKKIRQVPECYFLPRRSLPSALAIYGAVCAAGVGAGMLLERTVPLSGKWANDLIATSEEFSLLLCSAAKAASQK
uniref:DPL2 protein n=1 Tax=Oryza glumipatula TaxID=40148 RepID=A0A0E0A5Y1_9ORYZ